jgi:hypothetical protein
MANAKTCPKCKQPMKPYGARRALPGYMQPSRMFEPGTQKRLDDRDVIPVQLHRCTNQECRHAELEILEARSAL